MADWSQLPKDLLFVIAKRLETHFDLLHFRSVCPNWRASAPLNLKRPSFSPPFQFHTDKSDSKFFLSKHTVCLFNESSVENSHTSPRFWLGMIEEDKFGKKHITNPLFYGDPSPIQYPMVLDISKFHVQELDRLYIQVIDRGPDYHSPKVSPVEFLNVNPHDVDDNDDFIIIGELWDNSLNCFKFGDQEWTKIEGDHMWCLAAVQFERKFYFAKEFGNTICVDPFVGVSFTVEKELLNYNSYKALVQFCENLLLVETIIEPNLGFEVFQLDEERKRWVRLESLGDGVLFFGVYSQFSAPAIPGVKGNCIVFVHALDADHVPREHVFDMSSGMIVHLDDRPDLLPLLRPPSFF